MTNRALMALMMIAKFETGRADRQRWKLNVSGAMHASLRRSGLIDDRGLLTESGWEIEGEHAYPKDGTWFVKPV
jgi:hypothetical protein